MTTAHATVPAPSSAVTVDFEFSPFGLIGPASGELIGERTIRVEVGAVFEVLLNIDEPRSGIPTHTVLTSIAYEPDRVELVRGLSGAVFPGGGFGGRPPLEPLVVEALPDARPAGELAGLAHTTGSLGAGAVDSSPGDPEIAGVFSFRALEAGTTQLLHFLAPLDESIIDGELNDANGAPGIELGMPFTVVVVPEPATAVLTGLGLVLLSVRARSDRRPGHRGQP